MCTSYLIKNIPIFTFFTCGIKKKMFSFTLFEDKLVMIKSVKIGSFGFGHYLTGSSCKNGEQSVVSIDEWVNLVLVKYTL
jgi:hypothetical protein